jgi:hypothetical protein
MAEESFLRTTFVNNLFTNLIRSVSWAGALLRPPVCLYIAEGGYLATGGEAVERMRLALSLGVGDFLRGERLSRPLPRARIHDPRSLKPAT